MADHLWDFADSNGIPNSQSKAQEDHSWHLATSKLAFAEHMRAQSDWASPPHPKAKLCELKDLPYESKRGPYYDDKTAKHMKGMKFKSKPADDGMNQTFTVCDTRSGVSNLGLKLSSCSHGFSDKRFKSLPPAEMLPRSEPLGGYIFVCNNDTMAEDLKRQLFGLPQRYRDSVRAIQPGLPLFLYNYTTHQLYGVYEAASFGGSNIDPTAWEDKKCRGESRFPAQVRVRARNIAKPLEEDSFRPVLHHYDGPKFRLQLSIPETLALLDLFSDNAMV